MPEVQISTNIPTNRAQEIDQGAINSLAAKYGLEPTTLETGSDRRVRFCLMRDAGGENYLQAYVTFQQGTCGDIHAHVGLFGAERRLVNNGSVSYGDIDAAFDGVVRRFDAVLAQHAKSN